MFFSLLVVLWMTYEAAGNTGPLVPLTFIQEPTYTVARRNEPVTLNCGVVGSPPPSKVTWQKDGRTIIPDSRRRVASNGALLIIKVIHKRAKNITDVGEYQCFASSSMGRIASHKVLLDVAGMSKRFLKEPQSTITWEGSAARFSCQIRQAVPPAIITWEKDGRSLSPSDRIVILEQGVLQIKGVKKEDEGNYRCIATNIAKTRQSQFASLTVQTESPKSNTRLKFLGEPHNITVTKGGSATLDCAATGYPVPVIEWKKVNGNVRGHSSSHGVSNLNFTNVVENDGGEYVCQASSDGRTISRFVWLSVRVPPEFETKPRGIEWTVTGPITFKCTAKGSPTPTLYWLKNGYELSSRGTAKVTYYKGGADLNISKFNTSDRAVMYQCLAKNEVGSVQTTTSVIIQRAENRPGPPTNVVALSHSSSSIILSWSPPVGNYSIKAYTVHYKWLGNGNSKEVEVVVNKDTNSYKVSSLDGFSNYSFYVKAYTKFIGENSEVVVQRTLQGRPSRSPMKVNVSSQTPDSLEVSWQPPPKKYQNGIIVKYVISYKQGDTDSLSTLEVAGNVVQKTINGLSKGKTYSIEVSAATVKGNGPSSPPVTGTVLLHSTNVISPPTLWIVTKNSSALNLKWLPPKYGQDLVKEYHVFYDKLEDGKPQKGPFVVGKQHQSYTIKDLSPGSHFVIKMMAWDGKKNGLTGAVYAATDSDPDSQPPKRPKNPSTLPPAPPTHLVCSMESPTSILVTWQRPPSPEWIAYYTVKYYPKGNPDPVPKETTVYSENIIMTELTPGKEYTISVRSHYETETDKPPASSTAEKSCSIPRIEPKALSSPPRNVKYEYISSSSVKVMWEQPIQRIGEVSRYEIFYTYNSSYPDSKWMVMNYTLQGLFSGHDNKKSVTLKRIKEDVTFYLKIRAGGTQGHGDFSETVKVQPPSMVPREAPNVTFTIISSSQVQLSWICPRTFDAPINSFTLLFTTDRSLSEDEWSKQTVVISSSTRFPDLIATTIKEKEISTYYVKVRAEYDDNVPGKWSKILHFSQDNGSVEAPHKRPEISVEDDPEFNVKLGIIIGCAISAFCIVVLLLFIVWKNPCRQAPLKQSTEKAAANGLPVLNGFQQIAVPVRHENSASTETSASSGMCQCRCTCGAARWPLRPTMVRANDRLPGSSDSSTPITQQMFTSSSPGGPESEESGSQQELRHKRGNHPGSSSSSLSVELHRNEQLSTMPASSRSHTKSVSVDV